MSRLEEKTIKSQTIYEGNIIRLQLDQVTLPDGRTSQREIVKHPGAVAVVAITDEKKLVLVRQFRKPLEKTILEIPAGKLEPGEDPRVCAFRELKEETGYRAEEMTPLVSFYTSPGFADEIIHLYVASGLHRGEARPDQDEFVELVELTLPEAWQRIADGEICDAKTVAAVYHWQLKEMQG
ncbi:ADP-ribose pyrophosphatase [Polycladomyces abyssicola]|uniref:ADP-ribose pyrophosphatase n=1 Tax=Polycladomyces abyssicola TaxID=1125966 RepID=A0A8D5UG64_9BACL|nr:NUDIX hydrolase [Polycladomyces abyssicola]BCU81669.1 ADP-ribose pyrophosphatase [Polycladomyces abyssicola]